MNRFGNALSAPGFGAIAEFKRRSPSAGDLRPGGDVVAVARAYTRAGARAMSVLVDGRFAGSLDDLSAAREATTLPLLAKGFFSSAEELRELARRGADAALLLLRDLSDEQVATLMTEASALGIDTLLEAHDAVELARAASLEAPIVGLNARDLESFAVDRRAQLELLEQAPPGRILVAESGIETRAQGAAAELAGANAILVGSTLMRAADPGSKLAELVSRPLVKVCGLTRSDDVERAVEAGADMVGFVLDASSPRAVREPLPAPGSVLSVAVLVGEERETGTDLVQLYARDGDHRARDGVLRRAGRDVAAVVDLPWGADDPGHWERARRTPGRVMLAGGLDAANVAAAIGAVSPWAVDSARGTERSPGVKDETALQAFVEAAR